MLTFRSRGMGRIFVAGCILLSVACASLAFAEKEKPAEDAPRDLQGVVARFVYSPKGPYEGLLLQHGEDLFQVSFPAHQSAEIAAAVRPGDEITVVATPEPAKGYHLVFKAHRLKPATGAEIAIVAHGPSHAEAKAESPQPMPDLGTISGVVQHLNYAKHGEANGVVLEDGDFVHLRPDGVKTFQVAVGKEIVARGPVVVLPSGVRVMEHPETINGQAVPLKPPKKKPLPQS